MELQRGAKVEFSLKKSKHEKTKQNCEPVHSRQYMDMKIICLPQTINWGKTCKHSYTQPVKLYILKCMSIPGMYVCLCVVTVYCRYESVLSQVQYDQI